MRRVVGVLVLLVIVVALSVVVLDRRMAPGDRLTGIPWHWTGTTSTGDVAPIVVPDPSQYTVEFGQDRTYVAVADCTTTSGTFRVIPAGRMGPLNGLDITPDSEVVTGCDPGSLSGVFVTDLDRAIAYRIADRLLTISLADGRTMTFR